MGCHPIALVRIRSDAETSTFFFQQILQKVKCQKNSGEVDIKRSQAPPGLLQGCIHASFDFVQLFLSKSKLLLEKS